jgi:hypothetical protein
MVRTNPLKTVFRNASLVLILACAITLLSPISGYAQGNGKSMEQRLSELTGKPVLSSPILGVKGLRKFLNL